MRHRLSVISLACVLLSTTSLLVVASIANAQEGTTTPAAPVAPTTPSTDVAGQLAAINASLADIATLLKRQAEQNDLGILMKRVELQNFLLMETNRQAQSLRETQDSLEAQMESIGQDLREWDDEPVIDERVATGEDVERLRMRKKWKARMEREQAKLVENLKKVNAQVAEYDAQAANTRDDIARWQAMIDDWLERSGR